MNVSSSSNMQQMQQTQMRKMDGSGGGQGQGMGKMMNDTISQLPEESQADIKSLMQGLDQQGKQDAMSQISQLDTTNMSVDEITSEVMSALEPAKSTTQESTYPDSSFTVYA